MCLLRKEFCGLIVLFCACTILAQEVFLYCENCVRRQLQVVDVNAVVEHKFLKVL